MNCLRLAPPLLTAALSSLCWGGLVHALDRPAWQLDLEQIMAEPDWIGPPVESPFWSLDGQSILYSLREDGSSRRPQEALYEQWRADLQGGTASRVDDADLAGLDAADPVFSSDRSRAAFIRDGDVFLRPLGGALQQLTRSNERASALQFSANQQRLQWRQGNDWFEHDPRTGLTRSLPQIKAEKDPDAEPDADNLRDMQLRLIATLAREKAQKERFEERQKALRQLNPTRADGPIYLGDGLELNSVTLSPSARYALVATSSKKAERGQSGKMPKYVTESGYEEVEDVRTRVGRNTPAASTLHLVDLQTREVHALDLKPLPGIAQDPLAELRKAAGADPLEGQRDVDLMRVIWSRDGERLALMLRAIDNKDRWIAEVDLEDHVLAPRHRLTDPAWINWNFNDVGWMNDQRTLWFLSEESGYSHLYTLAPDAKAKPKALTSGKWEASEVSWTADGAQAYFLCNRAWPGDYEVCRVNADGSTLEEVTELDGVESFLLSPDETRLALRVSSSHTPPQLAVKDIDGGAARTLTDTRTPEYRARSWPKPQFVQVPSKHGAGMIWGKFYAPANREPGKRYPIALFVHGAGYLQNVSARYPAYFREQMFHHLLVEKGYLVLDLDFRASEGYGRDWRTAIYRQMGHPELEDYLDGIDWLVEEQQGDRSRVGVYGGSYGGFIAFMAMFRAPEAFHAGAALRPVTDWAMYNHPYTSNILNTPALDPEAYRKSSPIEHAEGLQGHLLIAHGMIDDNVFYQDSVRLSQRLVELRKDKWNIIGYPLERHGYVHPEAWYDQYRRIFELFETALKP